MKNGKLKELEKMFNMAEDTIESISQDELFEVENAKEIVPLPETEIMEIDPIDSSLELFSENDLKVDFLLAKRNVHQLIRRGQHLLDTSEGLEIEDLKSSQVEAISHLSDTVGKQLNSLLEMYKTVATIEQMKKGKNSESDKQPIVQQNNAVFVGSMNELLKTVKENG